jgi:diaminopimelate decarboxylase
MKTLELFPEGTRVDPEGQVWLGGCPTSDLAHEFGTPLYVFDETTLRARSREYVRAVAEFYPGEGEIAYASKAYLNLALAQLFHQQDLGLDVVSGGELYVALQAGFPARRIHFHGNNKSEAELIMALEAGVGRIVVDNARELELLERVAAERTVRVRIWLRLSPGVDAHTHAYRKTGQLDSKFGFPLATGDAERALVAAENSPHLDLVGVHAHIGSQIDQVAPFVMATSALLDFVADMKAQHGFHLEEFSPGGGWGVAYQETDIVPPVSQYVKQVCEAVVAACRSHSLRLPRLVLEPGRSIVAPAGVALYRVGARKEIPGVRTYIGIDGGMADNIRPALYGAGYTALAALKAAAAAEDTVTLAGKFCESGDVLIRDVTLPHLEAGDLLAVPGVGAYCLSMANNYNMAVRPAVVLVKGGKAALIQRRETFADLIDRDLPLPDEPAAEPQS